MSSGSLVWKKNQDPLCIYKLAKHKLCYNLNKYIFQSVIYLKEETQQNWSYLFVWNDVRPSHSLSTLY